VSWDSVVSIATKQWVVLLMNHVLIPIRGQDTYLFSKASGPNLGLIQPTIQGPMGTLAPGIKRPVRDDDYSAPSNM
jgi:hypothetical protein